MVEMASGNTIANNGLQGVQVNPVFGICTAKSILGNSIYDNGGLGIDLLAFGEVLPIALLPGEVVTATATDSNGSTSESSACIDGTTTPTVEVPALGPLGLGLLAPSSL